MKTKKVDQNRRFKIGDEVIAQIGGPKMLVKEIDGLLGSGLHCKYWDGTRWSLSAFQNHELRLSNDND